MDHRQRLAAVQVGCTYTGTVVGAGFASGQEVWQFFGRFGDWGFIGIPITTLLFAWIGYRVMLLGHHLQARSYRDVNRYLFGKRLGQSMDVLWFAMLLGVCVAMTAGAGELLRERAGWPLAAGTAVTLGITFLTLLQGMKGVLRANLVIVPLMISFVLFATVHTGLQQGFHSPWTTGRLLSTGHPVLAGISAVLYAAFNLGLAAGVLIPLGSAVADPAILRAGSRFGAVALGGMLCALMIMLLSHYPTALSYAVPMGYIVAGFGTTWSWAFVLVLWGEIYSTLVGNVFAIDTLMPSGNALRRALRIGLVLIVALLLSRIGFANLVRYGYTAFGWASLLLLTLLLWPRRPKGDPYA